MQAATDFYLTIDRAARLVDDGLCSCRAAASGRIPGPHRRLMHSAIVNLERAQQSLFTARNDPWSPPPSQRHRQLELL